MAVNLHRLIAAKFLMVTPLPQCVTLRVPSGLVTLIVEWGILPWGPSIVPLINSIKVVERGTRERDTWDGSLLDLFLHYILPRGYP